VLRGEGGVCVGVMDCHVERMAGQLIVHAHPADVGMPQVMVEAQGTGDDAGVALTVAVDRLAIVGGKGSKVPTMKVRRVSVRCQVAVSARLRYAEGRWAVDGFSTSLKKWSAPGVLTRTTASLVLKLVRPTLRERVRAALAPELGDFVLELRSPLVVAGEFEVEAAPADGVASAPLGGEGDGAAAARRLVGWTLDQARGFDDAQRTLFAEDGASRKPLASLRDVARYLATAEPPPEPPATGHPRQSAEHRGLGAAWAEAATILSAGLAAPRRWRWADVAGAARRLRRRPVAVSLRLPTLAGAAALGAAHARFWAAQERRLDVAAPSMAGDGDRARAARALKLMRDKGAADLGGLAAVVRAVDAGTVDVRLSGGGGGVLAVDVRDAAAALGAPPVVDARALVDPAGFARGAAASYCPFDVAVRACGAEEEDDDDAPDDAQNMALPGRRAAFFDDDSDGSDDSDVGGGDDASRLARESASRVRESLGAAPVDVARSASNDGVAVDVGAPAWLSVVARRPSLALALAADAARGDRVAAVAAGGAVDGGLARRAGAAPAPAADGGRGVALRAAVDPALEARAAVGALRVRGGTADVVRELLALFGDADLLRRWWPGPVDGVACAEGLEVLRLLEADVLGGDDSKFRKFELRATLRASLRSDRGDTVLSAATARAGVAVDARLYARDLLFDASRAASAIHTRRLEVAVDDTARSAAPSPAPDAGRDDAAAAPAAPAPAAAPPPEADLQARFDALTALRPRRDSSLDSQAS